MSLTHLLPATRRFPAILVCLLFCTCLGADRVVLINGREIEGEIVHQSEQSLTIRTDNGIVSVPATSVASVMRESAVQNRINMLARAFSRGDIRQAIIALDGITSSQEQRLQIDPLLIRHADAITNAAATASPSDSQLLTRHIRNREGRTPDSILLLLARIAHARGDLLEAARQVQLLSPDFLNTDIAAKQKAATLLSDALQNSLESVEPEVSIELMRAFARLSHDTISTSTATAIYLSNASARASLGDYPNSLRILGEHVLPVSPAIAVTEIGGVLDSAEKRTSPTLFVEIQGMALEILAKSPVTGDIAPRWDRQVRALISIGKLDEAASAALRLSSLDADEGARLGFLVELERRKTALPPDDPMARYKLGIWAGEVGLNDQAIELFNSVRDVPALSENAKLQIDLIRLNIERGEFEKVYQLFAERKYDEAIRAAEGFRSRHVTSEFARKAGALVEVARYERTRVNEARPAQADALYQNAERLYLQGRTDEVIDIINRIETDYANTEAARRASGLREKLGSRWKFRPATRATQTGTERAKALREQQMREIRALSTEMMSTPSSQP